MDRDAGLVTCEDDSHCPPGWSCPGTAAAPGTCIEGSQVDDDDASADDDDATVDDDDTTSDDDDATSDDDDATSDDDDATADDDDATADDDDATADDDDATADDDDAASDDDDATSDDDDATTDDDDDDATAPSDDDDVTPDDDDTTAADDDDTTADDDDTTSTDLDADGWSVADGDCDDGNPSLNLDDIDGDTWTTCDEDCDDLDATSYPGAPELCDGVDNDCDSSVPADEVDGDADGFLACADCDDTSDDSFPGASENCDGEDNDCNGAVPSGETDGDGDSFRACAECDDGQAAVFPGAEEQCDGLDTDCSGVAASDELDVDGDSYLECDGYVDNDGPGGLLGGGDCDDGDPGLNPGVTEVCDGDDENCSGIDEGFDSDGDGFTSCGRDGIPGNSDDDCDDTSSFRSPGYPEVCDLIDNDCDGAVDAADADFVGDDYDLDGHLGEGCGGFDCDDADPYVHPGAGEACDGGDTDCDGLVDAQDPDHVADYDGDGFEAELCGGTDCDDRDKHVFPEAVYTSGVDPQCAPVIYPGFRSEWHAARISLPSYFFDPVSENHYIYFRGHHTQELQAIGVVEAPAADPDNFGAVIGPVLEAAPSEWDHRNPSSPTVAYIGDQGFANPYVMLYYARLDTGGLRQIGLASSNSPLGPFERVDPEDGTTAITAPVLAPAAAGLDNDRTLHPSIWYDTASSVLNVWYNGRPNPNDGFLRLFHATSNDGGVTWTRTDVDSNGEADVIFSAADVGWVATDTTQVNWVEDPINPGGFEFWYTGEETAVGYATATDATTWNSALDVAALDASANCARFDGEVVTGRGIRYNSGDDSYHWYYGGQTDIGGVDCPLNEDDVYSNGGETASYVGHGINYAPAVALNPLPTPASSMVFSGTVTDTAPDQVTVSLQDATEGALGTASITPTGNTDPGVQTTTWSRTVTGLSPGVHTVTVTAIDEAGTERTDSVSFVVP